MLNIEKIRKRERFNPFFEEDLENREKEKRIRTERNKERQAKRFNIEEEKEEN